MPNLTIPRSLSNGEVHLFRLDLSGEWPDPAELGVSEAERARAERFAFDRDRIRYLRAKHAVRRLLSAHVGIAPQALGVTAAANGKPQLDPDVGLGFNLSHSGDRALVAIARTARVGVDIEQRSAARNIRALAHTVCTADELRSLSTADESRRALELLTCWTRKEAYLKALGVGLSMSPRTVHVGIEARESRLPVPGSRAAFVTVTSLLPRDDCVAAVAVEAGAHAPVVREFDYCPSSEPRLEAAQARAKPSECPQSTNGRPACATLRHP